MSLVRAPGGCYPSVGSSVRECEVPTSHSSICCGEENGDKLWRNLEEWDLRSAQTNHMQETPANAHVAASRRGRFRGWLASCCLPRRLLPGQFAGDGGRSFHLLQQLSRLSPLLRIARIARAFHLGRHLVRLQPKTPCNSARARSADSGITSSIVTCMVACWTWRWFGDGLEIRGLLRNPTWRYCRAAASNKEPNRLNQALLVWFCRFPRISTPSKMWRSAA